MVFMNIHLLWVFFFYGNNKMTWYFHLPSYAKSILMHYTNSKTFLRWLLLLPSEIFFIPLFPSFSRHKRERERERERERDASIDGGVTSGKDGRDHGSVDPAYAEWGLGRVIPFKLSIG